MSTRTEVAAEPCRNCGDPTPSPYCPTCGQRKGDVRVSVRRLIADVLEDQLSINSALPRTLFALFVRPGRLTAEYMRGRIASYIAPFRLYLVASIVFFLLLSFLSNVERATVTAEQQPPRAAGADSAARATDTSSATSAQDSAGIRSDSAAVAGAADSSRLAVSAETRRGMRFGITIDSATFVQGAGTDWIDDVQVNTGFDALDSVVIRQLREMSGMDPQSAMQEVVSGMLQRAPTAMFLLLPVFAFMLKLLYIGSRRFYVEHFIFSLHFHAFAFLLFTVMLLLENTPVPIVLFIWLLLYLPLALHRVYGQNWFAAFFKAFVLGVTYSIVLVVAVVGTLIVAFLLL